MNSQNVLIIADKEDMEFLGSESRSNQWNLIWKVIDYSKLHKEVEKIRDLIAKHDIDFILYSRNDQVAQKIRIGPVIKKLGIGYSSFSGIDEENRIQQMMECFRDFMECDRKLSFASEREHEQESVASNVRGTFSLLFDTEQLGGAKYGLPRILNLLNKYDVKATFFMTNLIKKVYSNILEVIQTQGHEIGIHGMWHEYLSGLSLEEQKSLIKNMIKDFGFEIYGANFIGRMEENSVYALLDNKIRYFVYPVINCYRLFSYPKLSTIPSLICKNDGNIWAIPISVETYGLPWFSIKNMLDSALLQSTKCKFPHISILCHPFRDGNLQHIETTERLLHYLVFRKKLKALLLKDVVKLLSASENFYRISEVSSILGAKKIKLSLSKTRQDFIGIIPENLILILKKIRRNCTIF